MNKKITVRRDDGKVRFCILAGEGDLQAQLNEWYFGAAQPSGGYKALLESDTLRIIDCIAYDTVTTFDVLSIEDTDAAPTPHWTDPETLQTGWN